ncbi:dystrophin, isoforms A/C/F/G/H isoform X2 [Bemisia tabaci]|uniref:dystrophin, isoforms A/C/F/G/H isoform X2 n=1 Tax=Bemisia tabaci TaxID=7038 RepID=UPI003B2830BB
MDVVFIDEREDVQKKTFTKWINSQLVKCNHSPINDLFKDLHDGSRLLALLEVLTGRQFKQEKGRMRVHHINNVNKALQILQQNNVKLVNISSNDIVDGNPKLTLGLVWSIILHWQVHYHLKDLMSELQQTNLEKTLLAWCRLNCADYTGVDIRNFTTSWSDGLAFNALLHKFRPELFDYDSISRKLPHARLEHAFRMAEKNLGIDRLLDPEDVNTSVPDKKSIMTYVMCLFQSLPHEGLADASIDFTQSPLASPVSEVPSEGIIPGALRSRPLSLATNVSVELGGYQVALEEVLTWLLEAEDKLTSSSVTPGDLDNVKQQFYAHEEFLLELSGHQEGVGAVLEEGARMLSEGGLSQEEEDEVRVQMKLLNSRWEELRVNAMEKQTRIHEILMKQQQKELENLRVWLTGTEDRISRLSGDCGMDLPALLDEVSRLKQDLQNQQKVVDALANLVVVVDETTGDSDTAYSHMEDQLSALGERWAHVCQWAEEKGNRLGSLLTLRDRMRREAKWLQGWMDEKEVALKLMEADPVAEKGAVLQRVKQLQILRHQINAQQNRLARLQEIVQEIDAEVNSSESAKEAIQIETLADRWEALVQITDVQAQRIADSGLECNLSLELAIVPREEPPPSPTTSSPMVDQRKRRRMKNSQQTEIESSCEEINSWLEETEEYLHSTGLNAASINQIESVVQEKQKVIVKLDDLVSQLLQEQELPVEEKEMVAKLKRRLNNVEEILSNFACKEKSEPYKQYEASKSEFIKWISEAENLLRSDESIVLEIPELRKQLQQIKDIQEGLAQHENEFREVKLCGNILMENAGGNVAIQVQTELSDLEKRWTELLANIGERVQNIEAYIVRVENMASDISTMEAWLDEVNSLIFVNVDESVGNLEASATRVLESKAVLDNIAEMKENEIKIEDSMKKLMSDSFKTSFTVKLMEQALALHDRWNMTESAAKQHNERMEQLHENNKTVLTGIEELSAWLDDLEESLSPSNTEIVNAKVRYQQLKQNIHDKSQLFRTINDLGNSMVAKSEGGDLRQKLTQLNTRWNEMTNDVFEKHKALQSASEQYGEFRALVAKEKDWLDKLEKLLIKKSPNTAADAEELSEELDDLENFIRNHSENSIARIQDIGQHLMSNQVVTDNIETEINNISDRFTSLSKKAQDRAQVLEVCVAEAQECESHVNVLQSWLENVNIQLTERLQNDLTADDLPQDVQRLSEEFEVYTKKLLEIEEKVCLYEEAGKQEASTRLKEQLSLVNEKFKSVSEKFEQFKSPEKYALKLHRALRELRSIEEAVCLLELTSDDPEDIQGQLNHCMRFYNTLSDVKSEIELVLQEGRKAVEEGRTENPEELTKHLDDLKDLYNKLGVQVSESKNCLETALELSKVLHEELPALLAWVHGLEQELDQVESTPVSHRYLDAEYSFIKETLEVDCEKWGQVKDNVRAKFRQFSSLCSDPVYLEVLRDRVSDCVRKWDRIKERLIEAKEQLEELTDTAEPIRTVSKPPSKGGKSVRIEEPESSRFLPTKKDAIGRQETIALKRQSSESDSENHPRGDGSPKVMKTETENSESISVGSRKGENRLSVYENVETQNSEPLTTKLKTDDTDETKGCQMVEVKASEIVKSSVEPVEHVVLPEAATHSSPMTVEMVEILEDTEESATETDPDEKVPSPAFERKMDRRSNHKIHLGPSETLIKRQKLISDEALRNKKALSLDAVSKETSESEVPRKSHTSSDFMECDNEGSVKFGSGPHKVQDPTNGNMRSEAEITRSQQSSGRISSHSSKKRVEGDAKVSIDDSDSFYGSDKEIDEPLIFSGDEGKTDDPEDSSSSDDENFRGTIRHRFDAKVTKSSSAPANATTQRSSNNEEPYEKKQRENLSSVDSDIREFSLNTDEMLKRMNEMLVTIQGLNDEQDPGKRLEVLEREVSSIAPDAASLISRGDGLVLAVHSKNPALGLHLTNTSLDSLRAKWSQLMSEVELRKLQAQQAEKMIKEKSELLLVIKEWLKKMNQELELANNDENKLKLLCKDFESKEKEVDRLKEINSELQIQQINDKLMISDTIKSWDSFQQKLQSLHKNTTIKNLKQMEKTNEKAEVISKINRTREEISQISRRLNSRSFRCYDNHAAPQQEAAFKAIKEEISKCKPQVEELDQDHKKLDGCGEQAKRVAAKLKDEWSHLNKNFSDKYRQWQSAHMAWEDLQRDCKVIEDWLSGAETQVKSWSSPTTNILLDMGVRVTDLEKQLIGKRRVISTLNELLSSAGVIDAKNRLSGLQERWQQLYEIVLKYKSKLSVMESSQQCLDHVNALLDTNANPSDDTSLSVRLSMVKAREEEVALKKEELELVKAKETGEQALNIDSTLTVLTKAGAKLAEHREYILCKLSSLKKLISRIDNVSSWVASIKARVSLSHSLHDAEKKKMQESISACVKDCETEVKEVLENVINLEKECQGAKQPISSQLKEKVKKLREDWMFVKSGGDPKFSSPEPIYSSTSKGAGAWIDSSSRNVESTTATASPSPPRAILLATFDKSILQIRDWLTLEEEMLKQQSVTVGDVPAILQVLDKQKNVLRELEQKKPQLDELVHTAENLRADSNRQQLHGKVTKLREHWDEANNAVVQRKATLDAMLSDSQRYDSKRQEVEAWLNRMETRLDRMPPVGHTADVLDTQIREQKSFHAEVHQYKSNIDILSKLTQQLVAVYQQDDTSRVKKTTEQINMRYNNLNSSIVKRGELLHSAINSLHNLDRSLDKFLAWLSETESALETVETDPEKQATHLKVSPKSSILNL